MPNALRIALLLVSALIAAIVVRVLYVAASTPKPPAAIVYDRIPVAAANLPQGLLLRASDLKWQNVPHGQVPSDVLAVGQSGGIDLKGALLRKAVSEGALIRTTDVIPADAPDFLAAALNPGMRAISVAIDEVSGNAGLIQPGDYVDVLLTQQLGGTRETPAPAEHAVESETIAQRVRVLAVGSTLQRGKAAGNSDPASHARTITLEVSPHTAQVVAVATHLGALSLALRSFATNDRRDPSTAGELDTNAPPVWAGDVSRALRTSSPRGAAAPVGNAAGNETQPVVIYRGSKVDQGDTSASTGIPGLPPLPTVPSGDSAATVAADAAAPTKH